ncbi:hypothetical protein ACQEVB_17430 [Pseudonocardia sp. CA-107938]|uniref:hypothetical protein n=1 Tax=Pseudonocardia sp. CA-107938 TaxID=3240021 RepID=UPI003D93FC77
MSVDVGARPGRVEQQPEPGRSWTATLRERWQELARGEATPDRLRRACAVLVLGCLVAGVVSLVSGINRTRAVADGGERIGGIVADAAQIYRSLADADAMATSGFVSGGQGPAAARARYDADVARASARLIDAAGKLPAGDPAAAPVATLAEKLPVYTSLVETARVYNRQNLPLGQSYLSTASKLMATEMLPAAAKLRSLQTGALGDAFSVGGGIPWAPLVTLLAAIIAVVDVSMRESRRTNRAVSPGLAVAGGALALALIWWVAASVIAGAGLGAANRHATVASALDDASTAVLQARSNESLVLVARNSGGGSDSVYVDQMNKVLGPDGNGGLLAAAAADADPAATAGIDGIRTAAKDWQAAHANVRKLDDSGDYRAAVDSAIGTDPASSGTRFDRLDAALTQAVDAERAAFASAARTAETALFGLAGGPAVLALVAAAGAVAGLGRRIGEYR